jgi:predicted ribosome quality control (RQC) complex YloA/Tae2 family protein
MRVVLDLRKSVPDNAKGFYDRGKKARGKLEGMGKAIADSRRKLESAAEAAPEEPGLKRKVERRWYEKFRWFHSSQGYLVIGGRDASTNELLLKKHLEGKDLVFHANVQGAPFFVVKNPEGAEVPAETRAEAAQAAASYSKAWAHGMGSADVYEVDPPQVSKTPPAGEYLPKGAFMVYGQKRWHKGVEVKVAIGYSDGSVFGGPPSSVAAHAKDLVLVGVGEMPQGALAKKIRARFPDASLDDIQRSLPPGGGSLL